ncbi:MAG: hypothetical protein JNM27_03490 [Leptospirales bacterium]|nr:hypothetical protein [Leptospirales bacterium]
MITDNQIRIEYLRTDRGDTVRMCHIPTDVAVSFQGSPDHFQLWRLRRRLELEVRKTNREPIVTSLPLRELNGSTHRSTDLLTREAIKTQLRSGSVSFVVANIGDPLDWYSPADAIRLWKGEVKSHLIEKPTFNLADLQDEYGYLAYSWPKLDERLISLEKHH